MTAGDGFDVRSLAMTLRPGAHVGNHRHLWAQLVFACSGVMRVSTAAETWLTPATKAIWLPAGIEHCIDIRGEVAMRTLYITPKRAALLPGEPATLEVQPLLRELILHIVQLGMLAPDRPEQNRMAGVLVDLLGQARREGMRLPCRPMPEPERRRFGCRTLPARPTV